MLDDCLIVVCDGSEFQAFTKGCSGDVNQKNILPIPIGVKSVRELLTQQNNSSTKVLVIGLGGSLSSDYQIGDVLIYDRCCYWENNHLVTKNCDRDLNNWLQSKLTATLVAGLTIDKIVTSPSEKEILAKQTNCQVVDMESSAVINHFAHVSVVRVISDNYADYLPNLNRAITSEGKLDFVQMSIVFLQEPFKASKLIQNALLSLRKLKQVSKQLTMEN